MRKKLLTAGLLLTVVCGMAFLVQEDYGKNRLENALETVPAYQSVGIVPTRAQIGAPVQFNGSVAAFDTVTIGPAGGVYTLANGISLEAPPGAVSQDTAIGLRRLAKDEVEPILRSYGKLTKYFLAGFAGVPEGLAFNAPIKITLPCERLADAADLPYPFIVDPEKGIYSLYAAGQAAPGEGTRGEEAALTEEWVLTYSDDKGTITVDLRNLPPAEVIAAAEAFIKKYDCLTNKCCSPVQVFVNGEDITQTDFCFEQGVSILVRYPKCPGQPQFEEILGEMKKGSVKIGGAEVFAMAVSSTLFMEAFVTDAEGKPYYGPVVVWSSDNPAVATISSLTGIMRTIAPGQATITADIGCDSKDTVVVIVGNHSLSVTPASPSISIGDKVALKATALDSEGNACPGLPISWSSLNPALAAICPSSGPDIEATGLAKGIAKIQARCGNLSGFTMVEVKDVPITVSSILIDPPQASLTCGQTATLKAIVKDGGGAILSAYPVSWQSSKPAVADVSADLEIEKAVIPRLAGTATITATAGARQATASVNISAGPIGRSIVYDPRYGPIFGFCVTTNFYVGDMATFSVAFVDNCGNQLYPSDIENIEWFLYCPPSSASAPFAITWLSGDRSRCQVSMLAPCEYVEVGVRYRDVQPRVCSFSIFPKN